jgi:hypothetical protein
MRLKALVGEGDHIMLLTLPLAAAGIVCNIIFPRIFQMHLGPAGLIIGSIMLVIGIPLWLSSAIMLLVNIPRKKLITTGPFALMKHPLYTSVALLVLPGVGLVLDTWVGFAIGAVLYIASRIFSGREDQFLEQLFAEEYRTYRSRVLLPWL